MSGVMVYLLAVNLIGAAVTAWDKRAARRGAWRVPEKTLFLWCVLGGCPGVYLTMRVMHHKTLHKRFMWGIPAIFAVQCVVIVCLGRMIPVLSELLPYYE